MKWNEIPYPNPNPKPPFVPSPLSLLPSPPHPRPNRTLLSCLEAIFTRLRVESTSLCAEIEVIH